MKNISAIYISHFTIYFAENIFQAHSKEGSIRTYEYDAGGNLLKYKKYTVKDGKQTLVLTDSYAYGNTWKDQMTSYNGSPITYDDMGNPLTYLGMKLSWEKGREKRQKENWDIWF